MKLTRRVLVYLVINNTVFEKMALMLRHRLWGEAVLPINPLDFIKFISPI
jgi:hypothetical protein